MLFATKVSDRPKKESRLSAILDTKFKPSMPKQNKVINTIYCNSMDTTNNTNAVAKVVKKVPGSKPAHQK